MSTLREAAQQALEHVQEFKRRWMAVPPFGNKVNKATRESVSLAHTPIFQLEGALRTALAEPEQEPVAWVKTENFVDDDGLWSERIVFNQHGDGMPLYTRPVDDTTLLRQAWEALRNDDIQQRMKAITALRERLGEKT